MALHQHMKLVRHGFRGAVNKEHQLHYTYTCSKLLFVLRVNSSIQ